MTINTNVTVVDYGSGNLFNIKRAFAAIGVSTNISSSPEDILKADKIVLPGVGAFKTGISHLQKNGMVDALKEFKASGKQIFGICLGMQLLVTQSEENGLHMGLDFIPGKVTRFTPCSSEENRFKIPQICWNTIEQSSVESKNSWESTILSEVKSGAYMYFLHSYFVQVAQEEHCLALTPYGNETFHSAIQKDNVMGCQFHPERSGEQGLSILKSFVNI
jgi:imidazole glycerol-phosphate synthase subunit HisH